MHFNYAITSSRCSHDHAIFQSVRSPPPIPETARCLPCKRLAGELDGSHGRIPPINIFQQGHDFVAVAELPGVRREDLSIEAKDGTIRISGKKTLNYGEGVSIHRRERLEGAFDRTITLPVQIDSDRIKAEYKDGILALFIPRAESDKPRSIQVA